MKRCMTCGAELELRPARCPLCGAESGSAERRDPKRPSKPVDDAAYQAKVRRLRAELRKLRDDGAEAV